MLERPELTWEIAAVSPSLGPLWRASTAATRGGMAKRIGFVVSHEADFAEALVRRLGLEPAIEAELVTIGGVTEVPLSRWDVIVDSASDAVPHYRAWLRAMALAGATIVNDPFSPTMADRFFALAIARRAGVRVPRMVLLPQHSYGPGVDHARGLRNLENPWRWGEFAAYVKLPALLRDVHAGLEGATLVGDMEQLWRAFDATGTRICALQQHVEGQPTLRGIGIGGEDVVLLEGPIGGPHRVLSGAAVPLATRARAADAVRATSRALGLELCAVDLAVVDDAVWVLDAGPRIPTLTAEVLGPSFDRVVEAVAALLIRTARAGSSTLAGHPVARVLQEEGGGDG